MRVIIHNKTGLKHCYHNVLDLFYLMGISSFHHHLHHAQNEKSLSILQPIKHFNAIDAPILACEKNHRNQNHSRYQTSQRDQIKSTLAGTGGNPCMSQLIIIVNSNIKKAIAPLLRLNLVRRPLYLCAHTPSYFSYELILYHQTQKATRTIRGSFPS
ncbi:hypothetical protein [Pediococcus cellicola]|nr:hypothetical protein [Pediococcus cellicola]